MVDNRFENVIKSAFGRVAYMFGGTKFPQYFSSLRLVTEEVLHQDSAQTKSQEELMNILESNAAKSSTTNLWVGNLMKPVFIMMVFVRAERKGDWPLHLRAVTEMLAYFFARGHQNYAR